MAEWFNLFLAKLKRREPAVVALLQAQELDASEALKVELYEYEWAACTCKERTEDSESEEALWERGSWWRRRKVLDISFVGKMSAELDFVNGLPVNYRFGVIVSSMIDRMYKESPPLPPPAMPQVPLRLVITGKPFAGKKTVARRLAEAYNLEAGRRVPEFTWPSTRKT
ncbi:unnamed protein product [Effrenium voratum]|nr:unnamed protein product [Effrenium voratum]